MSDRRPAVAGRFYPADPDALARLVDGLLDAVSVPSGEDLAPAYIVPHAGLRYSGPTAAHVYARLRLSSERVGRVVLCGPAHFVRLVGCAVPASSQWSTPLGSLPVVVPEGTGVVDDAPHAPEHALEVQLPFLQRALRRPVPIVPVAVGQSTVDDVAAVLTSATAGADTVVLCSTDLSHYLDDTAAREQDDRTAQAVLDLAPERIGPRDACGVYALRGLLGWARASGLRPSLLDLSTSADTSGDRSRVVGYSAFAFRPRLVPPAPAPPPSPRSAI